MKSLSKIILSVLFCSLISIHSSSAYATLVISDNSLSLQFDRCNSSEVRGMVSESILNSGDIAVSETTEDTALFKFRYPRNAVHDNLIAQFVLYNSSQSEVARSSSKALHGSTAGFISEPVRNIDDGDYYVLLAIVLSSDKQKFCLLTSETTTITKELANSNPSLISSEVTPSNIRANESVSLQSIWQDLDSNYITDVTARYRLISTSNWSQAVLDAISGDVRTGYTFNRAVVMTQAGNYEVEFRASDSNGNTTAFQGRRTFTVTEDNNAAPTLNSSRATPESLTVNESVSLQSIWQDLDSNYITDVTARYRLIGTSNWSQAVLDAISGDVRTGYTFNRAVVMTQAGNYEVEFRASDSNGNTTAFQGRRTFTVTEDNNAAPTLNSSRATPESLTVNESVSLQSIWQDLDSNYITDVTARYRLIGTSNWSQAVLDAISGDVRTGYTFNRAVVMTQAGNYEVEFRASDSNGNTTAFQGRRTFTVTEDNNAAPTLNSSRATPESLTVNESVSLQSIWQDLDSNYITDVTARYRLIGTSNWSQAVLDAISGDVRTGYTFNRAVVMTQAGNYEVEFRASDSNGNTTAFQGRRTFTVTEANSFKLLVTSQNGKVQGEGINCPSDCTESYTQESTNISLTATPNESYKFNNWNLNGTCSSTDALTQRTINVALSGDCTVISGFILGEVGSNKPSIKLISSVGQSESNSLKIEEQTLKLTFELIDTDGNLDYLLVDFDKSRDLGNPQEIQKISLTNGVNRIQKTAEFIFTKPYLANCPNVEPNTDPDILNDQCWRNHIRWKATVYDSTGLFSSIELELNIDDAIHIYDSNLLNEWRDEKEKLREELTNQNEVKSHEIDELSELLENTASGEAVKSAAEEYVGAITLESTEDVDSFNIVMPYDSPLVSEEDQEEITRLINGGLKNWSISSRIFNPSGYSQYLKHPYTLYIEYGVQDTKNSTDENANYPAMVHIEYHNAYLGHDEPLQSAKYVVNNLAHLKSVVKLLSEYAIIEIEGSRGVNVFDLCNEKLQSVSLAHKTICWSIQQRALVKDAIDATLAYYSYLPPEELDVLEKTIVSLSLDLIPVVGSIKSAGQVIVGKDLITDETTNRVVEVVGIIPYAKFLTKAKAAAKTGKVTYEFIYQGVHRFTRFIDLAKVKVIKPSFGFNSKATNTNKGYIYRDTFYEKYPEFKEMPSVVTVGGKNSRKNVHHAVEQSVIDRYPHLAISLGEMHSIENLRGIPADINNTVHLSEITKSEWKSFYKKYPSDCSPTPACLPSIEDLFQKVEEIDDKWGHLFYPPVRFPPK
ncbi:pre-toxin TG domain-containing protein [Pseudoalteromonas piscicida]|uniref:InlB B-repeat-containing protein n=1 Tax=Pseudoalteromonas piscicida TaxID=43662 RepID=UPI0030CA0C61